VCSRCGEPGEALEEDADPFTNGAVVASTEAGLKAALSAVSSSKSEAVITLTSDMTIGEGVSGNTEFDISASNVTISGAEGVTITLNQEITVSGNNVTFTGLNLDGSSITNTSASASKEHVIYVTGSSFTITDSVIDSSVQAGILVEDASSSYDITISNCDINAPRAVYAFASSGSTGTINLTISGSHLEGTYPFNLTRYNGTISVTDSELVGWTSYSTGTNATFKGCTFSFSDRGDYAYGMLRAYGPTVLDHCYFVSYDGSGVSSTNYVAECHEDSANANNFVISTGNDAAIYTVIDCQFEDVTIGGEDVDNTIEVKDITSETVVSLIETDVFQNTYPSSGFKFGSVEKVWTYSDLVPTTGGDEGGD
ncbi:MAG: hypothetical protein LUB56_00855, partial [Coprobacillus sp.]|nr:hypothetical protein [Coprobacillus sp.]